MARPVTLFTGQWADLPFETICEKAKGFGYDGIELATWGDHFEVDRALKDKGYVKQRWDVLAGHGLNCYAISAHLVGQAICDNIDERHKLILPPEVWGDGSPDGVKTRAAQRMIDTAKAMRLFMDARPADKCPPAQGFGAVVNGFTGSSVWHSIYAFPPTSQEYWQKGFDDFARRFGPILAEFEKQNVNFALEVHPTEIAFDIASAQRAIDAVKGHKRFGFNYDPSHLGYQHVDYVKFIRTFGSRIYHAHMKDVWWGHGDGTVGVFGGHTTFADPARYWDFRSLGHGDISFEDIIVALNDVRYVGPLSVEWEDSRMDREHGAAEAAAFVKDIDFKPSSIAFDAQFDR
ncbi:MAG TPA: sugar phosphate isomerase/epimerase [Tepidisphaeraceae bacterium]|nr:sugar phosphate isomerase/epimerase [Tepidisphaeraceae bacterium]